jgi:hypothetical protein
MRRGRKRMLRMGSGRSRALLVAALLVLAVVPAAWSATEGCGGALDLSGTLGLDTVVVPIPATLVDEIQLDTPAQLTLLKFGIESTLDASLAYYDMFVHLNTAMNIPGLERLVVDASLPIGPITLKPEMWFAVPFETVTDVNYFTNWVVIPPGDPLFVKMRCTFLATC